MPRKLRSPLESCTGRLKLPIQKKPYWLRLGSGLTLLYRRNQGPGSWSLRASNGQGGEWMKRFGTADDYEAADNSRVFSFEQAVIQARKLVHGSPHEPVTIDEALKAYETDLRARGANIYNAGYPRRHLTASLLSKPVALITADELKGWRNSLIGKNLATATINRVRASLRAALELAAKHRSHVWRAGLESLPDVQRARNVVLSDAEVLALVAAAYRHDPALGLLCDVLAVTGTRVSQATRLCVDDLQADPDRPRLMMPASGKGGGRNRATKKLRRYPIPITPALTVKLKAAAASRTGDAPLLLRSTGRPWSVNNVHADYRDDVRLVVKRLGHDPDVVTLYALRHSSITRQLLHNVPIRVIASTHNTSVGQIEKHYSRFISDHSDDLTRAALLHPEPNDQANNGDQADNNVIPLTRR